MVGNHLLPGHIDTSATGVQAQTAWEFRLLRALLGLVVGTSLAVAGAVPQAVVRNPLADPFVFGVSSGASVAAVATLTLAGGVLATVSVPVVAFAGALTATLVVFLIAQRRGRVTPTRLVLAGVAMSYLLSSVTSYLVLRASAPRLPDSHDSTWLTPLLRTAHAVTLTTAAGRLRPVCRLRTGGWLGSQRPTCRSGPRLVLWSASLVRRKRRGGVCPLAWRGLTRADVRLEETAEALALDAGGLKPNTWQRLKRLGSAWNQAKLSVDDEPQKAADGKSAVVANPNLSFNLFVGVGAWSMWSSCVGWLGLRARRGGSLGVDCGGRLVVLARAGTVSVHE